MKTIALFSGGLDSSLAIKLMQNQGIDVLAAYMNIGFDSGSDKIKKLALAAKAFKIELITLDLRQQFIDEILFSPRYGYGRNLNPCIDCHAFMMRQALSIMEKNQASFIITGEVLGERPMSQNWNSIVRVDKLAGNTGLVLRPLSAKLLPQTIPEKMKWVDRDKLLDISGRSRKQQIELAKEFGIEQYPAPAGGCLLTDAGFCKKLKDLVKNIKLKPEHIPILKVGRHFRLPEGAKLIVARDEAECNVLETYGGDDYIKIIPQEINGPSALLSINASENDQALGLRIIITYTKEKQGELKVVNGQSIMAIAFENKEGLRSYAIN